MAKSIRSKWKRKCRAFKRERYGVKELARLKKTLGIDENAPTDADMQDLSQIATIVDAKSIQEKAVEKEKESTEEVEKMEDDSLRKYNKRTMLDQFGNYPVWMNSRNVRKIKNRRAKDKKAAAKPAPRGKKAKRLTRREKKSKA